MTTPDLPTDEGQVDSELVAARLKVPQTSGLSTMKAALRYAEEGWVVLPVASRSGNPASLLGPAWHRKSSSNRKVIKGWFRQWPEAELAVDLGRSGAIAFLLDEARPVGSDAVLEIKLHSSLLRRRNQAHEKLHVFAVAAGVSIRSGEPTPLEGVARVFSDGEVLVLTPSPPADREVRPMWNRYGRLPALSSSLHHLLLRDQWLAPQPRGVSQEEAEALPLTTVSAQEMDRSDQQPEKRPRSTWAPVDLRAVLAGPLDPLHASLMRRSDGHGLLYPGMVHSFFGEPESGKSLLMQWACAVLLGEGEPVLYVDFESDERSVMRRLTALGARRKHLKSGFTYIRPEVDLTRIPDEQAGRQLLRGRFRLAV